MRPAPLYAALLAVLPLVGCASDGSGPSTYERDLDRLTTDCRERGGILAPTGVSTGRPQTDYFCKITGGASRLN